MYQYGAIDIGSNAIRLLMMTVSKVEGQDWTFKKNALIRMPIRLGEEVFKSGIIGEEKSQSLLHTVKGFQSLLKAQGIKNQMAYATSAMRDAKNCKELVKKIKDNTGIQIKIITGVEEASILYGTQIEQLLERDKSYLYVDVGGGSTEISVFENNKITASGSFNIGTIRMLQGSVKVRQWDKMKEWISHHLPQKGGVSLIGTGGNINKLFKLIDPKRKFGESISSEELENKFGDLVGLTYDERISNLGLNPDRADVIIPACEIYLTVLKRSGGSEIFVPKVGLTDGMVRQMHFKNIEKSGIKKDS